MAIKTSKICLFIFLICHLFSNNALAVTLQPVSGSPFSTGAPFSFTPTSVVFSPQVGGNLFAAVANYNNPTVSAFSVNTTTGQFIQVAGSPYTTNAPKSVAFSPLVAGNLFAAVANSNNNTVSMYSVNITTGQFTLIGSYATDNRPFSVAFSPLVEGNLFVAAANYNTRVLPKPLILDFGKIE